MKSSQKVRPGFSLIAPAIKPSVKKFALWNEQDFGYLAAYVAHNVLTGKLTGKAGQSFTAGRLGKRTVGKGGIVILSKPLVFTAANIDKFHF